MSKFDELIQAELDRIDKFHVIMDAVIGLTSIEPEQVTDTVKQNG